MSRAHKHPCGDKSCPQTFCVSDLIRQDQNMDLCKEIDSLRSKLAAVEKENAELRKQWAIQVDGRKDEQELRYKWEHQAHKLENSLIVMTKENAELRKKIEDGSECSCCGPKHNLKKCPYFRAEQAESALAVVTKERDEAREERDRYLSVGAETIKGLLKDFKAMMSRAEQAEAALQKELFISQRLARLAWRYRAARREAESAPGKEKKACRFYVRDVVFSSRGNNHHERTQAPEKI